MSVYQYRQAHSISDFLKHSNVEAFLRVATVPLYPRSTIRVYGDVTSIKLYWRLSA